MISEKVRNIILLTVACIIALAIILLVMFGTETYRPYPEALESGTCNTEECVNLGNRMKAVMKPGANPCDDFFEYSCGNYDENAEDHSEVENHMRTNRRKMFDFLKTYQGKTKSEQIALVFLKKCKETRNDPALKEDIWNSNDLTEILIEMAKVEPVKTGFIRNDVVFTPRDGKSSLFLNMRIGIEDSELLQIVEGIYSANPSLKGRNAGYVTGSSYNFLNLEKYFTSLLPESDRGSLGSTWKAQLVPNDFKVLEKVVAQAGVNKVKDVLKKKWKAKLEGYLVNGGDTEDGCFQKTESMFPGTFAMVFIKNFVSMANIETANRLFEDIRAVFQEVLNENTWLEGDLKAILIKELEAVKSSLGVPDEHKDTSNIDRMYARIEKEQTVDAQSYLTLARNILKMNSEETFLRVARVEQMTYAGETLKLEANYVTTGHRVSIAPIFLTTPFIDPNLPKWSMIASFGFITAHEMGHAFDARNYLIDSAAQTYPISPAMKTEYDTRNDCNVQKYSQFKFPDGSNSNGEHTKQEDSADSIGFNLAYRLFKKLGGSRKLVGFEDKSVEQVYFQRMAYVWCSKELTGAYLDYQRTDKHSAAKFRINGMMSNSADFARAFGCSNNSPMNPEKKCTLFK